MDIQAEKVFESPVQQLAKIPPRLSVVTKNGN